MDALRFSSAVISPEFSLSESVTVPAPITYQFSGVQTAIPARKNAKDIVPIDTAIHNKFGRMGDRLYCGNAVSNCW
jgi:hypothetical protein